ncbi:MAG: hypothetical protein QOE97_3614 [Pseudonocardiales bacterium]|jgi:ElaB/YqjD/DUF883 family membrane-anchored ribosome-binding protein|nr:hypothetical protein [Pseudonocardiales bacterium]
MSITSDIRSYADTALGQGKQVVGQTISTAQTQLNGVTEQANEFVGKLRATATQNVAGLTGLTSKASATAVDLRAQAEKAVNLEAVKAAVEPYVAQAKSYSSTVADRAEDLLSTVKEDKRVAAVVTRAEALTGVVVETVQERVVKPVQSLTGLGGSPKVSATKPAPTPVVSKPTSSASKAPAKKATVRKATTK